MALGTESSARGTVEKGMGKEGEAEERSNLNGRSHFVLSKDVAESPAAVIMARVAQRDPDQGEFLQAVEEVVLTLTPVFRKYPSYVGVFERLVEPERVLHFRVAWVDDTGKQQVNRGYRVQFSQALGPYKGGLRFHPSVNLSIMKFLGFEQILKNALTGLPLGGAKGGSDFDPKGKSDNEVMRFCHAFMTELAHVIGPNQDVPAGDIGVGAREVGFLFGQYRRLTHRYEGVLTGKGVGWGGSLLRPEATGYGVVYYANEVLKGAGLSLQGARCVVSGSGNVALFCVQKLIFFGAKPITLSDSSGYIVDEESIDEKKLAFIMDLKNVRRGRISEYVKEYPRAAFVAGERPWGVKCDFAFPCATQNEISESDAANLVKGGCKGVLEGANMPSTPEAINVYLANGFLYGPAKAANAGGVAVSGLEMAQNSQRIMWPSAEVERRLQIIMHSIYEASVGAAVQFGLTKASPGFLMAGANIAGFLRVAEAMEQQGIF